MTTKMTKNITENINKTGIITKKITSLFIPICLLLISFSLVNCPDPGNGNGNGGGQTEVPVDRKPSRFCHDKRRAGLCRILRTVYTEMKNYLL